VALPHHPARRRSTDLGEVVLPRSHWTSTRSDRRSSPLPTSHRPSGAELPRQLQDLVGVAGPEVRFSKFLGVPSNPTQLFRLPKLHRDHLQSTYNGHMLHSSTTDPFKLALYKLMGKIDPPKRTVPDVTVTTEDWLWFQLAMVCATLDRFAPILIAASQLDEEEFGGLRGLSDVVSGYGQRHFDGPPNQRGSRTGVWAAVLTICGQFERVCHHDSSVSPSNSL